MKNEAVDRTMKAVRKEAEARLEERGGPCIADEDAHGQEIGSFPKVELLLLLLSTPLRH